ncbi:MAG TPA: hypothetical protein VF595_15375 [Tepidisphaeraceae bacterium]|jgi:hypothetical protein
MTAWHDGQLDLDPCRPLDVSLRGVPAKWCVYLMSDADDRPVQMLCVRNLRASLRRRLGEPIEAGPSKRVDYRDLVRRVRWKRVDNPLESDLAFLDVARIVYPQTWQKIVTRRAVWWVHVDGDATHPRWRVTDDPLPGCGTAFGPLPEKGPATRLAEKLEDLFDLCRYHNVLVQAPSGPPCAYKDMGRCPAPCDGSVSMQQYRTLVDWSVRTLADPNAEIDQQIERMKEAAAEMRFELAGRIKAFIDGLKSLTSGDWRFVRPAGRFAFVSLQAGPAKGQAKLIHVTLGGCVERLGLIGEPTDFPALPAVPMATKIDPERLGLIVAHLFNPKSGGVFLPESQWTRPALLAAYKNVTKQTIDKPADEDEGVVREAVAGA